MRRGDLRSGFGLKDAIAFIGNDWRTEGEIVTALIDKVPPETALRRARADSEFAGAASVVRTKLREWCRPYSKSSWSGMQGVRPIECSGGRYRVNPAFLKRISERPKRGGTVRQYVECAAKEWIPSRVVANGWKSSPDSCRNTIKQLRDCGVLMAEKRNGTLFVKLRA